MNKPERKVEQEYTHVERESECEDREDGRHREEETERREVSPHEDEGRDPRAWQRHGGEHAQYERDEHEEDLKKEASDHTRVALKLPPLSTPSALWAHRGRLRNRDSILKLIRGGICS